MKRFLMILVLVGAVLFLGFGNSFGDNITIYDGRGTGTGVGQEENEVEPNMASGDQWQLDSFNFDKETKILSMTGTYDFMYGVKHTTGGQDGYITSGDIFIDVNGIAGYENEEGDLDNGYEYVFDINWVANIEGTINQTWSLYSITQGTLVGVNEDQNVNYSNPWQFNVNNCKDNYTNENACVNTPKASGIYTYINGTVDGFDFSYLFGQDFNTDYFITHFTMECGNDNLMGKVPVPEPATMLLLGSGLVGLAGFGRKKFFKKG